MTIKGLVSIIIPSRGEIFLSKTIQDILLKAKGDIEIIAVLDGEWPEEQKRKHWSTPAIIQDKRVNYLHNSVSLGMREAINRGVSISQGEYILKVDGHCMFDEGFDVKLKADVSTYERMVLESYAPGLYDVSNIKDNWIVIPRRKRLDAERWEIQDVGKPDVDYELLSSPADKGAKGMIWIERILERTDPKYDIDENMSFQGSCWFMTRKHFDSLGGLQTEGYGTFVRESQEIGLKTWLGGGKVMTNKKTWYAHLHKGKTYGRGYFLNKDEMIKGEKYCDDFWFNNRWKDRKYDLAWLIERFMPVPGWTPELIEKVRAK